jgi:hypothetical protein
MPVYRHENELLATNSGHLLIPTGITYTIGEDCDLFDSGTTPLEIELVFTDILVCEGNSSGYWQGETIPAVFILQQDPYNYCNWTYQDEDWIVGLWMGSTISLEFLGTAVPEIPSLLFSANIGTGLTGSVHNSYVCEWCVRCDGVGGSGDIQGYDGSVAWSPHV